MDLKYMTPDEIWKLVKDNVAKGNLMTAGSRESKDGSDKHTDAWGIVMSHAYSVIDAIKLDDGTKLVKLRNPHARDSYRGQYGAESPLWTKDLATKFPDAIDPMNGFIYLPAGQVKVSFEDIGINHNADKMSKDYYLRLNDASKATPKAGI
jgi:hypothetical protein